MAHAKYCYDNYNTIVNNIPKDKNKYDNTLHDYAVIDNKLAAAQLDIGESSNLAQVCLTYSYNDMNIEHINDYVCILSVLAQVAIDRAKRNFDVDIQSEIKRIKSDINIKENGYPAFWSVIRKGFNENRINNTLICPMNNIYSLKVSEFKPKTSTLTMDYFFVNNDIPDNIKVAKKIEKFITNYSLKLGQYNWYSENDEEYILLRSDFDKMVEDIRRLTMPSKYKYIFSWLINRAFAIAPNTVGAKIKTTINKNRSMLMKVLYEVNPDTLLSIFNKNGDKNNS